ncbi:HAMP domain-containing protein [Acidaminobacter sp. JC074]|uniref:sensor histidine kinase n=1 Tax=Acidaminobacter sp. JC074 TaxID=2530199 RepID=UPI001F116DDE|nr:HAMP domain-containing sensor histidine kinase [Acidaminobacter sp. JC074]MCH4888140.1 HAMP domain-containing protein [Acidaminobacter sp. JC074]
MTSIRRKLFMQIGSLTILLIGLLIISNTIFLEPFYKSSKQDTLIEIYNQINDMDESEYNESLYGLNVIEAKTRFEIIIGNSDKEIIYSTNPRIDQYHKFKTSPPDPRGPKLLIESEEVINDKQTIYVTSDINNGMRAFVLEGMLDNGYSITLYFPLAAIEANIDIINSFLLIIGTLIFLLALGLAYMISKSFTQPIVEMNEVTKQMKNFEFDKTCQINSNDEIGQLSLSINELSFELSNALESLNQKNIDLEKEAKEKQILADKRTELLKNVSHELKTPLALIQGYAEGLNIMIHEKPENIENYTSIILDESHKMNELIERILDIEQIENGHLIVNHHKFDIKELIEAQRQSLKTLIDEKHVLYTSSLASYELEGDQVLIERVVSNLLTNAIYHSKAPKEVHAKTEDIGTFIKIFISNTSEVFSQEELESLWDSFYKRDKARTRHQGGHGLGLSIVKAILDAHKSKYGIDQDNGTIVFWFTLKKAN